MNIHEMRYNLAINVAKTIFSEVKDAIFCGGTALNTFYLDYRYSEDIDVGYATSNPKTQIETLLEKNGYAVRRTEMKLRDIIISEGVEIKMDIFEYKPIIGTMGKDLQGISVKTLSPEEFTLAKSISFMTREDKNGLVRDAYDLYELRKIVNVPNLIKKYRSEIIRKVDVVQHNFNLFYEASQYVPLAIEPLLKYPVKYSAVRSFMKKIERLMI